jgi:hypothetical protein
MLGMATSRRFQFGVRGLLYATAWLSLFLTALAILGMVWRGDAMWHWPDAVVVPIVAFLLILVIGAPFLALAALFAKTRNGIIVSLVLASLYVAFNWMFANW